MAGAVAGDKLGMCVANVGDVNGDGYDDILFGMPEESSNRGTAYVRLGGSGGIAADGYWSVTGGFAGDRLGWSGAGLRFGNDGHGIVVGSPNPYSSKGVAKAYLDFQPVPAEKPLGTMIRVM